MCNTKQAALVEPNAGWVYCDGGLDSGVAALIVKIPQIDGQCSSPPSPRPDLGLRLASSSLLLLLPPLLKKTTGWCRSQWHQRNYFDRQLCRVEYVLKGGEGGEARFIRFVPRQQLMGCSPPPHNGGRGNLPVPSRDARCFLHCIMLTTERNLILFCHNKCYAIKGTNSGVYDSTREIVDSREEKFGRFEHCRVQP